MPSAIETAVETFIAAWCDTDPAKRVAMIEKCFAADGRMVTRGREIRGRAALADEMTRIHSEPQLLRVRLGSAIDARGTTFRYRGIVELRDGTCAEAFDAGEVDADGQICLVLTFAGPLAELQ